ncbi:MAG: VCBS repeat-containing protein, partial [Deltaproteobacteria bacterium]|nr:VCBS repeat-containing protein [Deltaproteobacteria bacterium]
NDLDDDCNGFIDEGVQKLTFFKDNDGDGFGGVTTTLACSPPPGYVADGGDCNDFNKDINPKAPEVCNDVDDNCNGFPDDGVPTQKIYKDNDADGFAAKNAQSQDKCNVPVGWTLEKDWNGDKVSDWDCNDSDVTMYPGAVELCDGKDNDCNGQADSQCPTACAGFPVSIAGASGWSSILLYDVNADGTLEIQAGSSLVKPDGSVLASGFPGNDAQMTDVDLDGVAEFIFGDGLYRFQGGAFVKVLALPNAAGLKTAVGDVDADGVVDLVRDNGAGLAVVRLAVQGSTISIKSTTNIAAPPPSGVTQSFPALLVDADANNTLEIFFGSGTSPNKLDGRLFVYKQDGAQYDPSKFVTNEQNSYCGGGDCIPLFFYSAGSPFISYSNVASQYVFDLAGKQVSKKSGEAMDLLDVSLSGTVTPAANYGTLVDVDGDGTLELLQSVYGQGWGVQRWNAGKKSWEWMDPYPLLAAQGPYRGPNAADVDNDNMLDVFYVSSDVKLHCYHLGPKSWGPDRMWWNRWLGLNDGLAAVNGLDTFESPTNAPAAMSKARYYRAMIAYSGDTDVFRYVYKSSLMGQFGGVPKGKSYILEIWNDDEYLDPGKKPVATFTNSGFSYSPGGGNPPAPAHHYSFKVYGKTAGDWHSSDPYYVMVKPW